MELLKINKSGVEHIFHRDQKNIFFLENNFPSWEQETFDIFNFVKDKNKIAIDLGAWIGTTCIWLSKNFKKVIAVEADYKSLEDLHKNIKSSSSNNVVIINKAIYSTQQKIFFGSNDESQLNSSVSRIKSEKINSDDYETDTITLNEIIKNENISDISFIKCDIEGGEEFILRDLIEFIYKNNISMYLSFHYTWWKNKNITDYTDLFKLIENNIYISNNNINNVNELFVYINNNPFCSIFVNL